MREFEPRVGPVEDCLAGRLLVAPERLLLHRGLSNGQHRQYNSPAAVRAAIAFAREHDCRGVEFDVCYSAGDSEEILLGHPGQSPQGAFAEVLPLFAAAGAACLPKIDIKLPPQQKEADILIGGVLSQLRRNGEVAQAIITLGRSNGDEQVGNRQMACERQLREQILLQELPVRAALSVELAKYGPGPGPPEIGGHIRSLGAGSVRMVSVEIGSSPEEWLRSANLAGEFNIPELVFWMEERAAEWWLRLGRSGRRAVLEEAIGLEAEFPVDVLFDMDPFLLADA